MVSSSLPGDNGMTMKFNKETMQINEYLEEHHYSNQAVYNVLRAYDWQDGIIPYKEGCSRRDGHYEKWMFCEKCHSGNISALGVLDNIEELICSVCEHKQILDDGRSISKDSESGKSA